MAATRTSYRLTDVRQGQLTFGPRLCEPQCVRTSGRFRSKRSRPLRVNRPALVWFVRSHSRSALRFIGAIYLGLRSQARFSPGYTIACFQP